MYHEAILPKELSEKLYLAKQKVPRHVIIMYGFNIKLCETNHKTLKKNTKLRGAFNLAELFALDILNAKKYDLFTGTMV